MTPKQDQATENPRMRALRAAHACYAAAAAELGRMRATLAFEKLDGVDLDGLTHALHILEAVDEQVVTVYGALALERDAPNIRSKS